MDIIDIADKNLKMQQNAHDATILLKSMANETRLMILCNLQNKELSVSQLLEYINLSQSALSQHLAILRREKLVKSRRDAQSIYYSLASDEVKQLIDTLYKIYCA